MIRIFLLILTLIPAVGFAQQNETKGIRVPLGQVVENMQSRFDSAMSYAIYLPTKYSHDRKWPLLIAMDPRGRALIPMELYREAAERLGYIIVSSYNTQSDAAWAPNVKAMQAIMSDIPNMFAIDDRRIYLTGFSGTAMGAWSFANNLHPHVAGLINFCGAIFEWSQPKKDAAYTFFGASGVRDFNYEEMRSLEKTLNSIGIPHRIVYFDGAHEWGSKEICSEGLDWMELQAMKSELRPRDPAWIDDLFAKRMEKAVQLESNGETFEAYREYKSILNDFSSLKHLPEISKKAEVLGKSKTVEETIKKMDRLGKDELQFIEKLVAYMNATRFPGEAESEHELRNNLEISSLIKKGANSKDHLEALWAQRMLETAFVQCSFYGPRQALEAKNSRTAFRMLAVADQIKPEHQRVLYMKAWAHLVDHDEKNALKFLSKMVERQYITSADAIASDPNFEGLRKNAEFQELLGKLPQAAPK